MNEIVKELLEALEPITEQDPRIIFRGHAPEYVELKPITLPDFHRLMEAVSVAAQYKETPDER